MYAKEEPLGLRMVLDGVTVLLPTIYDPSELRSDITGKLVRYLVDDGAEVEAGKPFAEAEAMKMIIQLKAAEGGKVTHEKQPGSIINQGDLLASLELKDPSKVKKILAFDGKLSYEGAADKEDTVLQAFRSSRRKLELVMDGYVMESEPLVAQASRHRRSPPPLVPSPCPLHSSHHPLRSWRRCCRRSARSTS